MGFKICNQLFVEIGTEKLTPKLGFWFVLKKLGFFN
jgi:hypothetical protein